MKTSKPTGYVFCKIFKSSCSIPYLSVYLSPGTSPSRNRVSLKQWFYWESMLPFDKEKWLVRKCMKLSGCDILFEGNSDTDSPRPVSRSWATMQLKELHPKSLKFTNNSTLPIDLIYSIHTREAIKGHILRHVEGSSLQHFL